MSNLLAWIAAVLCVVLWLLNIVWLCTETVVGMALARVIGIFFPPLGVLLGLF